MSYTPTNWKSGDVVTSTKLNKLEQGVANVGGGLVVGIDMQNMRLDKTAGEIIAASHTGAVVLSMPGLAENDQTIVYYAGNAVMTDGGHSGEIRQLWVNIGEGQTLATYASTESDYPVPEMG